MKKAIFGIIGALIFFAYYIHSQLELYSNQVITLEEPIFLSIPKGATLNKIIEILVYRQVINNPIKFKIFALRYKYADRLQAGDFSITSPSSPKKILEHLSTSQNLQIKVVIPEGYNLFEIAELLHDHGITKRERFLTAAFDASWLSQLNIENESVEGYLFPETYLFSRSSDPKTIIRIMNKQFWSRFNAQLQLKAKAMGLSINETITLASIIEKETGAAIERGKISSVFHNRLKQNIRLQTDPTVIYGKLPNFDGNLTKNDLKTKSPYNTYTNNGLPPGPIANPGYESIYAALYPQDTQFLYFVSKNDGTHRFSTNIRDHINAVNLYQKKPSP